MGGWLRDRYGLEHGTYIFSLPRRREDEIFLFSFPIGWIADNAGQRTSIEAHTMKRKKILATHGNWVIEPKNHEKGKGRASFSIHKRGQ